MNIEVWEIPTKTVAYVRNIGPYKGNAELFGKLFDTLGEWADTKELWNEDSEFIAYYERDPAVTPEEEQMLDICLEVPSATSTAKPIQKQEIAGGLFAVGRFELSSAEAYEEAWRHMFEDYIVNSEYEFEPRGCFEVYKNDTTENGGHIVEICVPIKTPGMF